MAAMELTHAVINDLEEPPPEVEEKVGFPS